MSNLNKKPIQPVCAKKSPELSFNRRYSLSNTDPLPNPSSVVQNPHKYNEGSVYRQAFRFNPLVSSSTNISSSVSGSVEVIVSDLEGRIDSQSKLDLSKLEETSNENSEDPDQAQAPKNPHKNLQKPSECTENDLKNIIKQMEILQFYEKLDREHNLHKLKLQILKAFNYAK